MSLLLSIMLLVAFTDQKCVCPPNSDSTVSIAERLMTNSVTVQAGRSQGSGTLCVDKNGRTWVLTAGHVIQGTREQKTVLDERGHQKVVISFPDFKLLSIVKEDGRQIGEFKYDVEVIRYSDPEAGDDLAVGRVRSRAFSPRYPMRFHLERTIPPVGTHLMHCGSMYGEFGHNSVTNGILSAQGRVLYDRIFDQTTCTADYGSSGGPIVLEDSGRYVGMVVRKAGYGQSFNLIVPVRRVRDWAERNKVEFVLDASRPVPSDVELRKLPVEENAPYTSRFDLRAYGVTGKGSRMPRAEEWTAPLFPMNFVVP
jgi:S1-C subfamily serine protease